MKVNQMQQRIKQQYRKISEYNTAGVTTFFVTFDNNQSAGIIEDLNPQTFPAKIRYIMSLFRSTQYFSIKNSRSS